MILRWAGLLLAALCWAGCGGSTAAPAAAERAPADTLRVMTYNIEDLRPADLAADHHPRLSKAAARLQRLRPDILLINELSYDTLAGGQTTAQRFARHYLNVAQADSLRPLRMTAFSAPVNTGVASGFDLDHDGQAVTRFPPPPDTATTEPPAQTAEGRAYGNDAFGFGVFPGQYGFALFVRKGLGIAEDSVRTFRLFPWKDMPGNLMPTDPESGEPWYAGEAGQRFRLSSKSHWDVPVVTPTGDTLHLLASHPTPPGFDGPEQRNVRRNHDEIRLWSDYLSGRRYLRSDSGRTGGLPADAHFVLLGDLNADPDEGASVDTASGRNAIGQLLAHPRIDTAAMPTAGPAERRAFPDLDPDDTARWGLHADYVLPSENLRVLGSGMYRPTGAGAAGVQVSDHFPVWIDVGF